MKLLLITVLSLCLFVFPGCEDDSAMTPAPETESHSEDDGHDHANEPEDAHADGEDHSDHNH